MACAHVLFIAGRLQPQLFFRARPAVRNWRSGGNLAGQFYLQGSQMRTLPGEILPILILVINAVLADPVVGTAGRRISCSDKTGKRRSRPLSQAGADKRGNGLNHQTSQQSTITQRLTALAAVLKLPAIKRWNVLTSAIPWGSKRSHPVWWLDANGRYALSIVVISRASRAGDDYGDESGCYVGVMARP